MSDFYDEILSIVYKHLPGKHNQKRHGWRYGGDQVSQARSAMRGQSAEERAEYRKRAGMATPKKVERRSENSYKLEDRGWNKEIRSNGRAQYTKSTNEKYFNPEQTGPAMARNIKATITELRKNTGFGVLFDYGTMTDMSFDPDRRVFGDLFDAAKYADGMLESGLNGRYPMTLSEYKKGKS